MCGAFDLDDSLTRVDCVVAMLKVKAQRMMGGVFKEDLTNRAADDVVGGTKLYRR